MLLGLNVIDYIGTIEVLLDESYVLERNVRRTNMSFTFCCSMICSNLHKKVFLD